MEKPRIIHKENMNNKYYVYSKKNGWIYYSDGIPSIEMDLSVVELLNKKYFR